MTIPYKPEVTPQATIQKRAKSLMTLTKRVTDLNAILEEEKVFFRDLAAGETLNIDVAGLGSLTVTKPSAATSSDVTQFNLDKFNALPQSTRDMLTQLGVVQVKRVNKPEGTPSVRVILNK